MCRQEGRAVARQDGEGGHVEGRAEEHGLERIAHVALHDARPDERANLCQHQSLSAPGAKLKPGRARRLGGEGSGGAGEQGQGRGRYAQTYS